MNSRILGWNFTISEICGFLKSIAENGDLLAVSVADGFREESRGVGTGACNVQGPAPVCMPNVCPDMRTGSTRSRC